MRKKSMIGMVTAICLSILLAGCGTHLSENGTETQKEEQTEISETTEISSEITEKEAEEPEHVQITWDPHRFPDFYADNLGDDARTQYEEIVDAILNQEESIPCHNDLGYNHYEILDCCFPIASAIVVVSIEDDSYQFIYLYDQETQDQMVEEFAEEVERMIDDCVYEGDSDVVTALDLFLSYTSMISYDYAALEEEEGEELPDVSCYRAIMEKTGICQSFAPALAHLYIQCGLDAFNTGGLTSDLTASHEWTTVKLQGTYYYVDPTFGEGGYSLQYFAFSDQYRADYDDYPLDLQNVGEINLYRADTYPIGDDSFANLRTITNCAQIYHEDGSVYAAGFDDADKEIRIDIN